MLTLYDEDIALWAEQQGRLLRESAILRPNGPIDWENIIEEIDTLGRSQAAEVKSRLVRIVEHLLKLQFSPAQSPRQGWIKTVGQQRADLEFVLQSSPSLRPRLPEFLDEVTHRAATTTADVLDARGETQAAAGVRTHGGRYDLDDVLAGYPTPSVEPEPARLGPRRRRR